MRDEDEEIEIDDLILGEAVTAVVLMSFIGLGALILIGLLFTQ